MNSQIAANDFAVGQNLIHYRLSHAHRNRKTDSFISAFAAVSAVRKNGGIDTDEIAMNVNHRAAGIAGVDGCIRLDEVFIVFDTKAAASSCTHDSHRGRLANSKWIADRENQIPNLQLVRIAQRQSWQPRGVNLQYRDVRLRISSNHLGLKLTLVAEEDLDISRTLDHVIVRKNSSIGSDDDARA